MLFQGSCTTTPGASDYSEVRIVPTIRTRVSGLYFESGDCIGLTIVRSTGDYIRNRMLTYDGSTFSSSGLLWYNDLNETSTLTAYYPYQPSGVPGTFTVSSNQDRDGGSGSDLLGAVRSGVTPASTAVDMVFYHLLSHVRLRVDNRSEGQVSSIRLDGLIPSAAVDLSTCTASARSDVAAGAIYVAEIVRDAEYEAIVVPQTADITVTVQTTDGKTHSRTVSSAVLDSGKSYDLDVVLTNIDISLTLSGEIRDWTSGGVLGGSDGGSAEVGSGTMEYAGAVYRTLEVGGALWMAENLRIVPEGSTLESGVWYPAGGSGYASEQGLLYDYATATCGSVDSSGVRIRGLCPAGWHLPDESELSALATALQSDDPFYVCGGFYIVSETVGNRYGSSDRGYILGTTQSGGKCVCLSYTSAGEVSMASVSTAYGLSVRCVRD